MFKHPLEVNGAPVPLDNGEPVRVDNDEFNRCTECGEDLESNDDGFGTTHGTCEVCITLDDEW